MASSWGTRSRRIASSVFRLAWAETFIAATTGRAVADRRGHRAQALLELLVDQGPALARTLRSSVRSAVAATVRAVSRRR